MARQVERHNGIAVRYAAADQGGEQTAVVEVAVNQQHAPPGPGGSVQVGSDAVAPGLHCAEPVGHTGKVQAVAPEIVGDRPGGRHFNWGR